MLCITPPPPLPPSAALRAWCGIADAIPMQVAESFRRFARQRPGFRLGSNLTSIRPAGGARGQSRLDLTRFSRLYQSFLKLVEFDQYDDAAAGPVRPAGGARGRPRALHPGVPARLLQVKLPSPSRGTF